MGPDSIAGERIAAGGEGRGRILMLARISRRPRAHPPVLARLDPLSLSLRVQPARASMHGDKFFDVSGGNTGPRGVDLDSVAQGGANVRRVLSPRDFDLPSSRQFTRIKILGDPGYTLYFKGRDDGGRRCGRRKRAQLYDVSNLRAPRQPFVVALRSANGGGAMIVSVDLTQDPKLRRDRRRLAHRLGMRPEILESDRAPFTLTPLLGRPRRALKLSLTRPESFAPRKGHTGPAGKLFLQDQVDEFRSRTAFPYRGHSGGMRRLTMRLGATGRCSLTAPPRHCSRRPRAVHHERSEMFDVEGGVGTSPSRPTPTQRPGHRRDDRRRSETRIFRLPSV